MKKADIRDIIERGKVNKTQLAAAIGLKSRQNLQYHIDGDGDINPDIGNKILNNLKSFINKETISFQFKKEIEKAYVYNIIGSLADGIDEPDNIIDWLILKEKNPQNRRFAIRTPEKSLECSDPPLSISYNSTVIIDPIETIFPGDIVVCALKSSRTLIRKVASNSQIIIMESYNKDFEKIEVDKKDILCLYKVCLVIPDIRKT